jgi:hypothetical protein
MLAISRRSGDFIHRIELTPLEIIFNKPYPSILLHFQMEPPGKSSSSFFRK